MKPGGSKRKGAQFERDICTKLSLWASNGQYKDWFWRSAMSGGRATVMAHEGMSHTQTSDISPIHAEAFSFIDRYSVELKFVKNLRIDNLIKLGKEGLPSFWEQVKNDAKSTEKYPVLIAKQNFMNPIICIPTEVSNTLDTSIELLISNYYNMAIYDLDEFLNTFTLEDMLHNDKNNTCI